MPTSDSPCVLHDLKITEDTIRVWLEDGRTFTVPLGWYPRLRQAKDKAQAHWRPESQGTDVHWPHLQERLLLETLLFEVPTENPNSGGCPVLTDLKITEDTIRVWLEDGRTFTVPLGWYPRLCHGTAEEQANWEPVGQGTAVHWPDLDEDVSIGGLMTGPSAEGQKPSVGGCWPVNRGGACGITRLSTGNDPTEPPL